MKSSLSPDSRSPIKLNPIKFKALNDMYPDRTINTSTELSPRSTKLPPLNTCVRSFYRMIDRPSPLFSTYYKRQIIGTRGLKHRNQLVSHKRRMSQGDDLLADGISDMNLTFHKRGSSDQLDFKSITMGSVNSEVLAGISDLSGLSVYSGQPDSYPSISSDVQKPECKFHLEKSFDSSLPKKQHFSRAKQVRKRSSVFSGISGAETSSLKSTAKVQNQSVVISLIAPSISIKSPTRELTHFFHIDEIPKLFWANSTYNRDFISFLLQRSSIKDEETHGRKKTVFKVDIQDLKTREDSMYGMSEEQEEHKLDGEMFECKFKMPYAEVYNPTSKENFSRALSYRQMVDLVTGYFDNWQKIAKECF